MTVSHTITQLIALIDEKINQTINHILHHSDFQALESSWRGVDLLINAAEMDSRIHIKVLDCTHSELSADLVNALEFDQSQIFSKVYTQEVDMPGGLPFSLLIGNYDFSHQVTQGRYDGIRVLREMMKVAAASFCPFIASADISFFGLDEFAQIPTSLDVSSLFNTQEFSAWRSLRREEDSRFIGLALPHILMRSPYNRYVKTKHLFFNEQVLDTSHYCWGNAAFAFAASAIVAFKNFGWFGSMRGVDLNHQLGSIANNLHREFFCFDEQLVEPKMSTDMHFTDRQEKLFADAGFLVLQDNPIMKLGVFYSSQSIQKAMRYTKDSVTSNAAMSSMLHYILSISRFAHTIKVIARDKVGSFYSADELENYLRRWLLQYCAAHDHHSSALQARTPLRNAAVILKDFPGMPGRYLCTMLLQPHYQFDGIETELKLMTELRSN